jgi:hypothetical protein
MTALLPWLIVGAAADRILVYASLYEEGGETIETLLADDPNLFTDIERHLHDVVDRHGRPLWDHTPLTWRLGTLEEVMALGARDDGENIEHIVCGHHYAPAVIKALADQCQCDRCRAMFGS